MVRTAAFARLQIQNERRLFNLNGGARRGILRAFVRWRVSRSRHLFHVMSQRTDTPLILVETAREACLEAARQAYEDAGIRGLCAEGRWEAALAAIRHVDLRGGRTCGPL
jgi:hypothetical protein